MHLSEPCTHRARPEEHCLQARCLSGVERDVPDGDVKVKKAAMTSKRPRVSGKMQQDQQDSSQDASKILITTSACGHFIPVLEYR